MKPQNLLTGLPIRHLEAATEFRRDTAARIPVGVVVERHKASSPWIDFIWRAGRRARRRARRGALDGAVATTRRTTYYGGAADIELYRTRDRTLPRQSSDRRAGSLGHDGSTDADPPYELSP